MKKTVQLILTLIISIQLNAQVDINLFHEADASVIAETELSLTSDYSLLESNQGYWDRLLSNHPLELNVTIPFNDEVLEMTLSRVNLVSNNFIIRTASDEDLNYNESSNSVFYQGVIEGYENSHFALSILENEIIGIGSIPGIGDVNLGKLKSSDQYIFFSESGIDIANPFKCETEDNYEAEMWVEGFTPSREGPSRSPGDCVGIYFEIDEDIYIDKGGTIEAADYIIALFNEVALLYGIDGINIYISDVFVWDVESPYDGIGSTSALLELFGTTTEVWTGDLGHFVSYRGGGGIAWVDVICDDQYYRKAVSDVNASFAEYPIYSWTIEVVSHEMGHNMGSPHTHACFWNGDGTAIDGCGPEAGYTEGCDAPLPDDGTVMSYCHLVGGVGIDLSLGFGSQPAELMQNKIIDAGCLGPCPIDIIIDAAANEASVITLTCAGDLIEAELLIQNNGTEDLVSLDIFVSIDGDLEETIDWTGTLGTGLTETVSITGFTLLAGTHTLQVEVANPNGEIDMELGNDIYEVDFEVTEYPTVLIDSYSDISCFGETDGEIDVVITGGTPDFVYLWDNGAGDAQDAGALGENTYTLTVTDGAGCIVEISQEINAPTEIEATASIAIELLGSDGSIDVTIVGGVPGYTYSWSNDEESEDINDLEAGTYILTVTDENGCTAEFEFIVDSQLGINGVSKNGFALYPNPATTAVQITNNDQIELLSIQLYNSLGQLVFVEESGTNSNYTIDVSDIAKGLYYIVLNTENKIQKMKLIIE